MVRATAAVPRTSRRSGRAPVGARAALIQAGTLEWRRVHREWQLIADGERVGGLVIEGAIRERPRIDGPSGVWEVRRDFWSGAVDLLRPAFRPVHYSPRAFGRDLIHCASGVRYEWGLQAWWRSEWEVRTESGFPLVCFRPTRPRGGYSIEIEALGRRQSEIEPLILLGAYLLTRTRSHVH